MSDTAPTSKPAPQTKPFRSAQAAEVWMAQAERAGLAQITGYKQDANGKTVVTYIPLR